MRADSGLGPAASVVAELATAVAAALDEELVGLYVYGSLVVGDFDADRSDIDLLAVVRSPVDAWTTDRLSALHEGFVERHPDWADRVEVFYIPLPVLRGFPAAAGEVVRISPGEPLHRTTTSPHWLIDLYVVQEQGVVLRGPPVADVLPRISRDQFVACARANVAEWQEWVGEAATEAFHAYVVLTLCRALYAVELGEPASKIAAAGWTAERYPQWAPLVDSALRWRRGTTAGWQAPARADVLAFVDFAVSEVGVSSG